MEISSRQKSAEPVLVKERRARPQPGKEGTQFVAAVESLVKEMDLLNARVKYLAAKSGVALKLLPPTFNRKSTSQKFSLRGSIKADLMAARVASITKQVEKLLQPTAKPGYTLAEIEAIDARLERNEHRSEQGARALIRKKALLPPTVFCERMSWTKQSLSKALLANRVFFVEEEGMRYYPAFFADRSMERRHLEAVSKLLGDMPGSAKLQFFDTAKGSLGGVTPLQALKEGKFEAVKTAAAAFAER